MNAKITITIPIERLSTKVAEILEEVASELENMSVDVTAISKEAANEKDLLKQIDDIDGLRKKMLLLDSNLEDCYSILGGLVKYKTQEIEQKDAEQATK